MGLVHGGCVGMLTGHLQDKCAAFPIGKWHPSTRGGGSLLSALPNRIFFGVEEGIWTPRRNSRPYPCHTAFAYALSRMPGAPERALQPTAPGCHACCSRQSPPRSSHAFLTRRPTPAIVRPRRGDPSGCYGRHLRSARSPSASSGSPTHRTLLFPSASSALRRR